MQRQEVAKAKALQEATEKIRKNQQVLIDLQLSKITKLKRMTDVTNTTPPMLRGRRLSKKSSRSQSSIKQLVKTSQPNRDSKNLRPAYAQMRHRRSGSKSPSAHATANSGLFGRRETQGSATSKNTLNQEY